MAASSRRLVAGLMVGVVVGVLGPVLGAVAFHSGNESGSEPVAIHAGAMLPVNASGSWNVNGVPFAVDVHARDLIDADAATEAQGLTRAHSGEVVAHGIGCTNTCYSETWRGTLTPATSDGNAFFADPTLTLAYFDGWLIAEHSGSGCHFRVTWQATDRPEPSPSARAEADAHRGSASLYPAMARPQMVTVDATCWSNVVGVIGPGEGTLVASSEISGEADQALDRMHPPLSCTQLGWRFC